MKKNVKPVARRNDLVIQEADNEVLVYDLVTNKASCLNETAAFVWQSCNGSNGIADIAKALGRKTDQAVNDDLVWLAIDELSKHKLLDEKVSAEYSVDGMSRREVIKKIGLGTMIALPIVFTLVAPRSVHANSSCVAGGTCSCNPADMGTIGSICDTMVGGIPCIDTNCVCIRNNNGNSNQTCAP